MDVCGEPWVPCSDRPCVERAYMTIADAQRRVGCRNQQNKYSVQSERCYSYRPSGAATTYLRRGAALARLHAQATGAKPRNSRSGVALLYVLDPSSPIYPESLQHRTTSSTYWTRSRALVLKTPITMPLTAQEKSNLLHPLVPESVQHNTRVRILLPPLMPSANHAQTLSQIRSLTSLLLGVAAGILGLESQWGFLFYFASNLFISGLIHVLLAHGRPGEYFAGSRAADVNGNGGPKGNERVGAWREIWLGSGLFEGLSGFVLGWAGVGGVIR